MKFRFIIIFIFISSCSSNLPKLETKKSYSVKGFAYIYNDTDYNNNIINGKLNNNLMEISQQNLRTGTLIKLINHKNKKSIVLKNKKRIKYPDFYKVLISETVANELNLNPVLPILEIIEIKKNKSFIAEKAKIYNEEKKISTKAPVASVQISNISKDKLKKKDKKKPDNMFIHIGTFYSKETAEFLKKRIVSELTDFNNKKIKIKKINTKETQVISGPYISVNLLKNDYIKLKSFGFEELDILSDD